MAYELHGTMLTSFGASISFLLAVVITQHLYTGTSGVLGRKILLYAFFLLIDGSEAEIYPLEGPLASFSHNNTTEQLRSNRSAVF